jgi:3-hydroxyacyl-[acyl-carrier-protein] dehydratase
MEPVMDISQILEMLPHRYPFILVDRVLQLTPGQSIRGVKNVTINEPFFQGHFPGAPVMPGVLIVEAMAQTGGLLVMATWKEMGHSNDGLIYFMAMDRVRFRKPVLPGDQLIMDIELIKLRAKVTKMMGRAFVDDQLVAEGELMASVGEPK